MERLRSAIQGGSAVLVVGTGFSAASTDSAETATWLGLIRSGAQRAFELGANQQWADLVESCIGYGLQNDDPDSIVRAASMVSGALRAHGSQTLANWLRDDVGSLKIKNPELAEALGRLHQTILTTNYDTLLEDSLRRPSAVWTNADALQAIALGKTDAIGHLHGIWTDPESVIFSESDYTRLRRSKGVQAVEQAVSAIKSIIYIGFGSGLSDPNFGRLLEWHRECFPISGVEHFRLCRSSEAEAIARLHAADNITPVPYGPSHEALPEFIERLAPLPELVELSTSGIVRDAGSEAQQALARALVADSVIAETIRVEDATLDSVLVIPVLLPVPHAEYVRARTKIANGDRIERIDPFKDASEAEYILVVGDDESGLTTTIKWMALAAARSLGNVAPVYVNFRECRSGVHPLEDRIRIAAREAGMVVPQDGALPPHVLAIDDLNANVPKVSERVLEALTKGSAFSTVIGCKSGQEDELIERLRGMGVKPRIRYLGRMGSADVRALARAISPANHQAMADSVMQVLRAENLPRTPLSVSLLLSIVFHAGRVTTTASQTLILDQYVSTLLGRGDPHEDARYEIDQPAREALLAGLAEAFVVQQVSELPEGAIVSAFETILARVGWRESPTRILRGLLDRRVLRRSGGTVAFTRHSYLYLFAAKRAEASPQFLDSLLAKPLFYASVLKDYAALVRRDSRLLEGVRPLILDRTAISSQNSPFQSLETIDPPAIVALPVEAGPSESTEGEATALSHWTDDLLADDEQHHPPFPAEDPAEMPFAMRLLRGLILVSTVLRDSDQVEDLPLKRAMLTEALSGWGSAVGALTEDPSFQEFTRALVTEAASVLVDRQIGDAEKEQILSDFARLFPAAMAFGGVDATLSSRKLLSAFDDLYQTGELDGNDEAALGAVAFAYSLRERGWPAHVLHLMRERGNQWIGRHFFLYLFMEDFIHDKAELADRETLLEVCVHLTISQMRFSSQAERNGYADKVRAGFRARRLRARGLGTESGDDF